MTQPAQNESYFGHSVEHRQELAQVAIWRPKWWREVLYVALFYGLYTLVRNLHGSVLSISEAERNAARIVDWERAVRLFQEERIQEFFLPHEWFIKFLNVYYGTAHFIVTIGVLLWLFHVQTDRYRQWRNVLFMTTGLALVGYMTFPLAPPRLLAPEFGFVDTLKTVGGLWDFDSGAVAKASNQYAAMPSLHVGWALWCAAAIMPILRHTLSRVLISLYPALTISAIVITGNHYWADVFGGALIFALGYVAAVAVERRISKASAPSEADSVILPHDRPHMRVGANAESDELRSTQDRP